MQNKQQLKSDADLLQLLTVVAEAYEQVSVTRMKKVRDSVLFTRTFLSHVSDVFMKVKTYKSVATAILKLEEQEAGKNGKKALVLLSSNGKLYGDIVSKVYKLFVETSEAEEADIVIVGKVGRELYEKYEKKRSYTYFDLPDSNIASTDLKKLTFFLKEYENVDIFYGLFEGFLSQKPVFSSVSGELPEYKKPETEIRMDEIYIFEPPLADLLDFFETQIFVSLLKQSSHEAELARHASRIRSMESTLVNIALWQKVNENEGRKFNRHLSNSKQQSLMSGISLWG